MNVKLYDVLIYQVNTREVDAVAGSYLRLDKGSYNAKRRADTVSLKLNGHYGVVIVEAGKFKVGDVLPEDAEKLLSKRARGR